jgi:hypothetical protein
MPIIPLIQNSLNEQKFYINYIKLRLHFNMTIEDIAKVCHEANRTFCLSHEDTTQLPWEDAPEWQRRSAVNGVKFHIDNPDAGPAASHENWLIEKFVDGWTYGPVKDPDKKQHPCYVPFDKLPVKQQAKDILFTNIVHSLKHLL